MASPDYSIIASARFAGGGESDSASLAILVPNATIPKLASFCVQKPKSCNGPIEKIGFRASCYYINMEVGMSEKKASQGRFVSRREAGDRLGVSAFTIQRMIEQGLIQAFRIGRQVKIEASELERYLESAKMPIAR
jgi:excisionase family DNA binding protein